MLIEPNAVRLTFNGQVHNLKRIESATGRKYSDGTLFWAVDGDTGVLEDVSAIDNPKNIAEGCVLQRTNPPATPVEGTVTGTIAYPDELALPPEAVVVVELKDLTVEVTSPAQVIAVYKTRLGTRKSPVPFKITADPAKIDTTHRYGLEAHIVVGDKDRAIQAVYTNVLTHGDPTKVDIVLVAAGPPKVQKN